MFFFETTPKPQIDDSAPMKSLINFFNNKSLALINTERYYTNFQVDKRMLTCPAVYLRVDRVKKGLENSFTGPFKVLERFDKYFMIKTSKSSSKISIDRLKPAYTLDFVNDYKTKRLITGAFDNDTKSSLVPLVEYGRTQAGKSRIGQLASPNVIIQGEHLIVNIINLGKLVSF